jgi:hypothetical protein
MNNNNFLQLLLQLALLGMGFVAMFGLLVVSHVILNG